MFILVTYDIPADKRRNKIAKILEDYGQRVQYSVFECNLTGKQLEALRRELTKVIDEQADSIRLYYLCAACAEKVEPMGQAEPPAADPVVYIV